MNVAKATSKGKSAETKSAETKSAETKSAETNIKCPDCGREIDVNELLYKQLESKANKAYEDKLAKAQGELDQEKADLEAKEKALAKQQAEHADKVAAEVEEKVKAQRQELEASIRSKVEGDHEEAMKVMEKELKEKSDQVKELNKAKADISRLQREKEELKSEAELEAAQKYEEQLKEATEKIHSAEAEKVEQRLRERDVTISQMKKQLEEAQRKAEQGSMQVQGEAQELAIEEWLEEQFPLDEVREIKKGERGGDCLQIVNTRTRRGCGTIYYESKRTKRFNASWIEKFKKDIQEKGADVGVFVTEAMPAELDGPGLMEGVWVCSFKDFRWLSLVLREKVIALSNALATQTNKGDKMGMLYDFLTSNEFKLQIEGIVEGFVQMQADLDKEKRAMQSSWKRRQKQIEKVLLNTNNMYGSIKGIAGSAIETIPLLELPGAEDESDED